MANAKEGKKKPLTINISWRGVSTTQKLIFSRYLAVMLKSGLTLSEAMDIARDQAVGKFKKIIKQVMQSVLAGNPLSTALAKFPKVFSDLFVNSVMAGENGGTLENNLDHLADQLKKEKELMDKVKSAMVYPIIVLIAAGLLGLAMVFFVLPKITPLFVGLKVDLPLSTRVLIWTADMAKTHGGLILSVIFFGTIFLSWLLKQRFIRPLTHYLMLKTPVIKNISRNLNIARFCQILGTLLKSGLNIGEALVITQKAMGNYYYQASLKNVQENVSQGNSLSDNLSKHKKYFPKLIVSMIRVGEKSGNLTESLLYLSEFYETEVDIAAKNLSTAIEPILLIGIGLVVGGMALSIITPIYQITGQISR